MRRHCSDRSELRPRRSRGLRRVTIASQVDCRHHARPVYRTHGLRYVTAMTTPHSRIPYLPARIEGLSALAMNLWWSWSREARGLFRSIDEALWHLTRHNPLELLCRVDPARIAACASDSDFLRRYDQVMALMAHGTTSTDTWFAHAYPELNGRPVAYFCAEFGLHNSVPIYSGGLGVLAGDHCKAASDLGIPMVGVGLFYMKGYFDQRLRLDGWQEDSDEEFDVSLTPLVPVTGAKQEPFLTTIETSGRPVHVRAWRITVGRVPLYLLDTNLEVNHPDDRALMNKLYAGGPDMRLRQEWILGVGGVRVLRAMGVEPQRVARQRRPRGLHDGRAATRVRAAGAGARGGRAPGPRPQRVHDAHAGAGGARCVLGRAARERGRAGVGRDGDRPRHVLPPGRAPGPARAVPHDRDRDASVGGRQRRQPPPRPGFPQHLARSLARGGTGKRCRSATSPTASTWPPGWRAP